MKVGDTVWVWWSASYAYSVDFVRWVRMRRGSGDTDTNKIGVGALVYSSWLFKPPLMNSRQRGGLPVNFYRIRPYHRLYRSNPMNSRHAAVVRRPKLKDVR